MTDTEPAEVAALRGFLSQLPEYKTAAKLAAEADQRRRARIELRASLEAAGAVWSDGVPLSYVADRVADPANRMPRGYEGCLFVWWDEPDCADGCCHVERCKRYRIAHTVEALSFVRDADRWLFISVLP